MQNAFLKTHPLVYVDDSADDHFFFDRAVRKANIPFRLQTFVSDEPALAYLRGDPPYSDRAAYPLPDFLLCDYDLGVTTGAELVKRIRALPGCAEFPIIMFSGIVNSERMPLSYAAGADHFLCKPTDLAQLEVIVKTLWACVSASPPCYDLIERLPEYEHCPHYASRF